MFFFNYRVKVIQYNLHLQLLEMEERTDVADVRIWRVTEEPKPEGKQDTVFPWSKGVQSQKAPLGC